ncbi:molybdenum-binding protein [Acinetobacter pittii 42F]|nr:molybdenum-binding protein [Acinetobacter pittii 42F]
MKEQNLKLQIRILLEQNIAFGPGKAGRIQT